MKIIFTIHDVLPETLESVLRLVDCMNESGLPPASLLVSPGRDWTPNHIDTLKQLAAQGHEMVGHGWSHRARDIRGLRHRLHAFVISRRAAEHLALTAAELRDMIQRCHDWFPANGLPPPTLYVPPAWGLGRLTRETMRELPFRWFETLTGIYDAESNAFHHLPLVGFEADTTARMLGLTLFNAVNRGLGRMLARPVRVAIHPQDLELKLGPALTSLIQRTAPDDATTPIHALRCPPRPHSDTPA